MLKLTLAFNCSGANESADLAKDFMSVINN
jgi:hypothetical protein